MDAVHVDDLEVAPLQQAAVAAAQVGHAARLAEVARDEARVAHDGVDAAQVAA